MSGNQEEGAVYLTVAAIAGELGVSRMTVYRAIYSGELEALQFRRSYRVHSDAYQKWRKQLAYDVTGENARRG